MEVRRVNGERVENLRHMKSLVECSKDSHWIERVATTLFFLCKLQKADETDAGLNVHRIELEGARLIVLDRREAAAAGEEILSAYRVPRPCSEDLLEE